MLTDRDYARRSLPEFCQIRIYGILLTSAGLSSAHARASGHPTYSGGLGLFAGTSGCESVLVELLHRNGRTPAPPDYVAKKLRPSPSESARSGRRTRTSSVRPLRRAPMRSGASNRTVRKHAAGRG